MSGDQNAGWSHSIKTDISFEKLEEIQYLRTTLTHKNSIQEEIKSRSKSWNACYYSVQNLLFSSLLSKHLKIKIYRIIILPVVLYCCVTWSLTLREERMLRMFWDRALRIFGVKREAVRREWRKLHNEELNVLYWSHHIVWVINFRKLYGQGM